MEPGCYTAIITPFNENGVDYNGLTQLVDFQIENGITGILGVGTTGESPTLTWEEHGKIVDLIATKTRDKCISIAGAGSNNTGEALAASQHAVRAGVDAILLVDPYYNGPSSLEIRREYIEPIAKAFPETEVIPYVIPGRTGAQLLPEDLALANKHCPNVRTVKEATGNIDNMRCTRACCGTDFTIISGDDQLTFEMMMDPRIDGAGVISVASNVVPHAIVQMVQLLREGDIKGAKALQNALAPLFALVTINTTEETPFGRVGCRARNPLGLKTLMRILGLPSGGCRPPLGKMTRKGLEVVLTAAHTILHNSPELFKPIETFFNIDINERLEDASNWKGLAYEEY